MRRRKSFFCVTKKGHWWVDGVGWIKSNDIDKLPGGASPRRPGPRTLTGAERMFKKEKGHLKIEVFYRRGWRWQIRIYAEK